MLPSSSLRLLFVLCTFIFEICLPVHCQTSKRTQDTSQTNAERFRRQLSPLPPRKLFDPTPTTPNIRKGKRSATATAFCPTAPTPTTFPFCCTAYVPDPRPDGGLGSGAECTGFPLSQRAVSCSPGQYQLCCYQQYENPAPFPTLCTNNGQTP